MLFLYNVLGTCYGCLIGVVLIALQDLVASYVPVIGHIKWYGFIALGVLLFNIDPIIKRKYEDPKIELRLKYIRETLKEGNFSDNEKREIWKKQINVISEELSDIGNNMANENDSNRNVLN